MKALTLLIILGIAGMMGYFALRGECPGGRVILDASECRGAGFDRARCEEALRIGQHKARNDYPPFADFEACQRQFSRCEPHGAVASGFVPRPRGICLIAQGSQLDATPVYERIGGPRLAIN
jgi:uncharacterized protein YgiB involved in biofilm formation